MIDIYTWNDAKGITYYTKIEKSITDVTAIPPGMPPDASLISANDWRKLVGEPLADTETFEQREEVQIALLGWKFA